MPTRLKTVVSNYRVISRVEEVEEGTGDGGHAIFVTVQRSGFVKANGTMKLKFSGTAEYGEDYIVQSLSKKGLTLKSGKKDLKFKIITKSDSVVEGDETIDIGIASLKTASTVKVNGVTKKLITKYGKGAQEKITILDDDAPPAYAIKARPTNVFEGDTGTGKTVTYTIARTGDVSKAGSVKVGFTGTAASGSDYTVNGLFASTMQFKAGAKTGTFTLTVNPDTVGEANETVVTTLRKIVGGGSLAEARSSASVRIFDEDGTQRVSTGPGGIEANQGSYFPHLSANGRIVAFSSFASNLVNGDRNGTSDVFLHNLDTHVTTRVSVGIGGAESNNASSPVAISGNGRFVAFTSTASNLVAGDTNTFQDLFVYDTANRATTRVSVGSGGVQGNGITSGNDASISGDGRYVAFVSTSSNLAPGDTNQQQDVFLHDTETRVTTRISITAQQQASENPSLSVNGRFLAYSSPASDLVTGDTNGVADIFLYDQIARTTTRVGLGAGGVQGNGVSSFPDISDDGRYVALQSTASNLVTGDTNGAADIFVFDRQTLSTTRVSLGANGAQANGKSLAPDISGDGRFVTFLSEATNLVAGDTNGVIDMFVFDRATNVTTRVSTSSLGAQANAAATHPSLSSDGRHVAFSSFADNLVTGDTNRWDDVFVHSIL